MEMEEQAASLCLKNNVFNFIVEDELKAEYYNNLNRAQMNNDYDFLVKRNK